MNAHAGGNIEKFKNLRRNQLFVSIPLLLIFAVVVLLKKLCHAFSEKMFIAIVALVMIVLIIFHLRNWRCPACGSYLDKGFSPHNCPRCGVKLRE